MKILLSEEPKPPINWESLPQPGTPDSVTHTDPSSHFNQYGLLLLARNP